MSIQIQTNASLQSYNSMAVPAKADALVCVSSLDQLHQSLNYANSNALKVLVLGEGSNTVFEDDYAGLVILNRIKGIEVISENKDSVTVRVSAGENWHEFVEYSINNDWYGAENLAFIPGLVGAAPMQNIGAYGVEVKDIIESVDFLHIASGKKETLSNQQCEFAYRESCFKNKLIDKVIITSVTFCLSKEPRVDVRYPALIDFLPDNPTPKDVFHAVIKIRSSKLPLPAKIPNTGSFFKNPIISQQQHARLKSSYPDLISYKAGKEFKLAAGWVIEKAGWKQRQYNGVTVHDKQALVLINPSKRPGRDVLEFARQIQVDIKSKFDVTLEVEPRIYT